MTKALASNRRRRERTMYYATYQRAREIRDLLRRRWPEARVVRYERGFAVQLRISGPYVGNRVAK